MKRCKRTFSRIAMLGIAFFVTALWLPSTGWAEKGVPGFQILFCEKTETGYTNRSLRSLGCRGGYAEISRKRFMERRLASGILSRAEFDYFSGTGGVAPENRFDHQLKDIRNGTGFFISDEGVIATNHHVVVGCDKIAVISKVDLVHAEFLGSADGTDLALLRTTLPAPRSTIIRKDKVRLGERVYAFGYPFIKDLRSLNMSEGIISAVAALGLEGLAQMTAALQPGNSGGPVVDKHGDLVGVAVAKLAKGDSIYFAIENPEIIKLMRRHGVSFKASARDRKAEDPELIAEQAQQYMIPIFCLK